MSEDLDDTIVRPERALPESSGRRGSVDLESTVVRASSGRPAALVDFDRSGAQTPARFYQFQLGSHTEPIPLDRPCFIGRRPSSPRVQHGTPPRLLRVDSPLKQVSSTHLEVRQLGSSVIVTDLKSTNGSVVLVPGSVPRKLRQGESVVVSPGTLVDIGDDNILQILPMQRLGQVGPDEAEAEDTR